MVFAFYPMPKAVRTRLLTGPRVGVNQSRLPQSPTLGPGPKSDERTPVLPALSGLHSGIGTLTWLAYNLYYQKIII
jgi:hypothetical protein